MNLMLLEHTDFIDEGVVKLSDRRVKHMLEIQKVSVGSCIKAGIINGQLGTATITRIQSDSVFLQVSLTEDPPKALPLILVLALPRPKMLKRILQTIATLGVKELYLINTWKVEKSYWQTPCLNKLSIKKELLLGLEQGCDTLLPKVIIKKRFKPFIEDELAEMASDAYSLVAHPNGDISCPVGVTQPTILAIGPEGGFIKYEVDKFTEVGFQPISMGSRIQRVETIIPSLLGKIFL
jgi:16S rRNA (uracil1498-N3)-methyltransferase